MSTLTTLTNIDDVVVNITQKTSYYGFKVSVALLELNTSVTLKVSIAYLVNEVLQKSVTNDGKYNYINKFVLLKDSDYTNWGADDSYITSYVSQNINAILNSTYVPDQRKMLGFLRD